MATYKVLITERLCHVEEVEAETAYDAVVAVDRMYTNQEIVLDSSNFDDVEMEVI